MALDGAKEVAVLEAADADIAADFAPPIETLPWTTAPASIEAVSQLMSPITLAVALSSSRRLTVRVPSMTPAMIASLAVTSALSFASEPTESWAVVETWPSTVPSIKTSL